MIAAGPSGGPIPLVEDLVADVVREQMRRVDVLAAQGCTVCGEPVAAIVWPQSFFSIELLDDPRRLRISEEVRFLCETHLREA